MKVSGKIDIQDQVTWINWYTDNPTRGTHPWWNHLFAPIALALPPFVSYAIGENFDWTTYLGVIICWAFLLGFWRFLNLIVARRKANREDKSYPFELTRKEQTICLSAHGKTYDYPLDKVGVIKLKQNLILTMDKFPICITPRNENLYDNKTNDNIEAMIKESAEQSARGDGIPSPQP